MFSLRRLSPTITNMIRLDHTHALATFHQYSQDKSANTKKALAESICLALEIHAQLEEAIFYPALKEVVPNDHTLLKSVPEHNELKSLIAKLRTRNPQDPDFDSTLMELMRDTIHHVADEETNLLPVAEKLLGINRLRELGTEMTKLRLKLVAPHTGEIATNTVKGFKESPIFWLGTFAFATLVGLAIEHTVHDKPV